MSEGFTPGPWLPQETTVYALNEERIPVNRFTAIIDSGWRNAESRISRSEMEANARLIAAAPDLYQHAEALLADVMKRYGITADGLACPHMRGLAEAIAKARGTA